MAIPPTVSSALAAFAAATAVPATSPTRHQQQQRHWIRLRAAKHVYLLLMVASSTDCCGAAVMTSTGAPALAAFVPTPSVLWSSSGTAKQSATGTKTSNFNGFFSAVRSTHRYSRHTIGGGSSSSSSSSCRGGYFAPARMMSSAANRDVGGSATPDNNVAVADSAGGPAAADYVVVGTCATTAGMLDPAKTAATPQGGKGAAVAATATTADVVVKRAVEPLPRTWFVTGLPKWMLTLRRRMLTKADWLHVHAASGLLFQIGGAVWLLNAMGMELFAGVPQLEAATATPLYILAAGVVNSLSSIPMVNSRSWVLDGVCVSIMQLWFAWHVSGAYPASLAAANPWLAAASFTILVISCVEGQEAIVTERKARELKKQQKGAAAKSSGHVMMRKDDHVVGDAIRRAGSLINLVLSSPHLYCTLAAGGWVERLAEAYPGGPALLFHAYFALATSNSIALLAPTLYARRLISANTLAAMQLITLAPLVTSAIDVAVMGSTTTGNPLELYLGFLH